MSGNSYESHEERGHKPARNMVNENHAEDQEQHAGKKPGHEQHAEEKNQNHEQHEGMKHQGHEQHEEMKHEQHEEMKHQGHEMSGGKDHGDHHSHMLTDFRKRFIVSFILTFPVLLLSPTIQSFFGFELRFSWCQLPHLSTVLSRLFIRRLSISQGYKRRAC